MDYQKIYDSLIERAKTRDRPKGYTERHHIVPSTLGGSDDLSNMARLFAREHFIAHLLLAKIHGGKMWYPLFRMSKRGKINGRTYAKIKREIAETISRDKERGKKISAALIGRVKTEEHLASIVQARRANGTYAWKPGRKETQGQKQSGSGNSMWKKAHSDSAREKIAASNRVKVRCPHCDKEGGIAIMKRWHFDNCRMKG